ncbi:hypothetical protein Tco_1466614 [Tanacetum coccineum]
MIGEKEAYAYQYADLRLREDPEVACSLAALLKKVIHHSSDQTVVGATSLSFSLDFSRNQVQKIRDNIANHRSALRDVFVSIVEPLSSVSLEGMESTSGTVPETTTALSVTFVLARSTPPISMDGYEIAHADDQGNASADVDPFSNVDDAELIIS